MYSLYFVKAQKSLLYIFKYLLEKIWPPIRANDDRQKHGVNGKTDLNALISANGTPAGQEYDFK